VRVEIFSRPGCHLCEEAKAVLLEVARRHPFDLLEHNVEEDPAWESAYGTDIPVVVIGGRRAFKHRVPRDGFLRYLERGGAGGDEE
jgi:glutaredoxin